MEVGQHFSMIKSLNTVEEEERGQEVGMGYSVGD